MDFWFELTLCSRVSSLYSYICFAYLEDMKAELAAQIFLSLLL